MKLTSKVGVFVLCGVLIAVMVIGVIKYFWLLPFFSLRNYKMIGNSMQPALQEGDMIIVSGLYYRNHKFQRGDIVLFHLPGDPNRLYVKRIAALGGEKVELKGSRIFINGTEIKKSWQTYNESKGEKGFEIDYPIVTVPNDTVFVLGDNMDNSTDSRSRIVGMLGLKDIRGKVLWVFKK